MNIIIGLLHMTTPTAAKYIVNLLVGNLRIGVADMSILDAIAEVCLGDKKYRELAEEKYNIFPDLGAIAEIAANDGVEGLTKINISVGIPIRMMSASRLPYTQISKKFGDKSFAVEYKYDGERLQVHKNGKSVTLFSRHLNDVTEQYPDIVDAVRTQITVEKVILEGECVAIDQLDGHMLPFQVVSTRRRKYSIAEMVKTVPVTLFAFDLLLSDTTNFMNRPYLERRKALETIIKSSPQIAVATSFIANNESEMVAYFEQARSLGAEGIMNKAIDDNSIYEAGSRGFKWIKLKSLEGGKMLDSIDAVVIGANFGKGKRNGLYGAFFLAIYNTDTNRFEYFTKCGSGFDEKLLDELQTLIKPHESSQKHPNIDCNEKPDVWIDPFLVMEIVGDELTKSEKASTGLSIRFPIFQRIRNDKTTIEITTTAELKTIFAAQ